MQPHSPGAHGAPEPDERQTVAAAERLLNRGEPLLAYNAVQDGLERWPENLRLGQLEALALARSGDIERSHARLEALVSRGHDDAETLGLLARTHKDLASRAPDAIRRAGHLQRAFDLYDRAFEEARARAAGADAIYTGINAATLAVLRGDLERARSIAAQVRTICLADEAGAGDSYWREATLGEAALILGNWQEAASHYGAASGLAHGRHGDLSSTRRQARLLSAYLPGEAGRVADALRISPVIVFTGNMIDQPGRPTPRFPAAIEDTARAALRERLAAIGPAAVYGSCACGADILCLEIARELGAETHVVLPFPPEAFRRASVDFASADWGARFERALAAADSVTVTSDHAASGSAATFEYANLVVTGMGRLRAQMLDAPVRGLAVWDRAAGGAAGGAASLVALWEQGGLPVDHVDLGALRGPAAVPPRTEVVAPAAPQAEADRDRAPAPMRHELRAMLFADAVGYSKLGEDQIPRYVEGFLGAVAGLCRRTAHRHEHVEVAGDGLYMVFRTVADAGHFALELGEMMAGFDRAAWGLPANFDLRIAVHCGPVHCGTDPITGRPLFTGPHTSRAARIEPITPPGQVYASSAFAAVAAASGVQGLEMRYVGRIPLAKGYGTLGLYNVRAA